MPPQENEQNENKQSLGEWREIVETVAAFATSRGGVIRIGVEPTGKRGGVQLGQASLEELAEQIKKNTDPPQYPSFTVEGEETAAVVNLRVEESPIKPVWAFGRPYKRVGRTNQRLSPEETRRLTEITNGRTWDALPCPMLGLEDLSREAVVDFLRRAGQSVSGSTEAVLHNLGVMTSEGLTYGAALLFAENPQRFAVDAQVKCGRFLGLTSVHFLDEQTLDGNLIFQIERALAFVTRNTRQGIRFTGAAMREIVPEYPTEAVREAITNAVCHRDYASTRTVQVRIYDDRLEIWNPGTLPPGLTIDDLYREHPSHPRNRLIAGAFYRARLIERWGTGTLRMIEDCEAAGLPKPEFVTTTGDFIVRFRKVDAEPSPEIATEFSDRQRQTIAYLREHRRITKGDYEKLFQVSDRQARRDLSALIDRGLLVRRGSGRATYYILRRMAQEDE